MAAEADRLQPVEIESDSASFAKSNRHTEFSGSVTVTQGSLKISADKVVAERHDDGNQLITATGKPVRFQQNLDDLKEDGTPQLIKGHANKVTFDHAKNSVVMSGNAFIDREGDTVSGATIHYNTKTSVYSVNSDGKKRRVSVVLQPTTVNGGSRKNP
ncbi:MAG: lipopolysaccharide transport periplasmic protein LptA [Neisseriaceae bacterium]|nr:lipopolysaccharide transport periplasmic protein LptA [Neisseriaceae bacterium]